MDKIPLLLLEEQIFHGIKIKCSIKFKKIILKIEKFYFCKDKLVNK